MDINDLNDLRIAEYVCPRDLSHDYFERTDKVIECWTCDGQGEWGKQTYTEVEEVLMVTCRECNTPAVDVDGGFQYGEY